MFLLGGFHARVIREKTKPKQATMVLGRLDFKLITLASCVYSVDNCLRDVSQYSYGKGIPAWFLSPSTFKTIFRMANMHVKVIF